MPEISRFYGLIITMYYNDHAPAHFHVKYGAYKAKIAIENGDILEGRLPKRAVALIEQWRAIHIENLRGAWSAVLDRRAVERIAPLE